MNVAIHQAAYAPWCGYFAKIISADTFIFLDDAQMSKNNLINRNKIDGCGKEKWLTIPVTFRFGENINQTCFADLSWQQKHRDQLKTYYSTAPFFHEVMQVIEPVYSDVFTNIADANICMAEMICTYLGIECTFYRSSRLDCPGKADDRLVALVQRVNGTIYVSGPGGLNYQDPDKFKRAGLGLEVKTYKQIPYQQMHEPFIPNLSVLDALFNMGKDAIQLMHYEV